MFKGRADKTKHTNGKYEMKQINQSYQTGKKQDQIEVATELKISDKELWAWINT